tara:strand:+ start:124 stop:357 length:234 start_codon:yes stop_codon:yes gene_type:complete
MINMLATGSFFTGTVKVYSTLIMLSFPTIKECTEVHNEVHGEDTKCFVTYQDTYTIPPIPLDRPKEIENYELKKVYP